ncbi:TetR/AcrR family transcriptional regulator (plasmid) [Paroceanicella profunda]|uniref:TetR/AcrR family transcriptional regulator n=1 Tax=Paroceanicella profunda TaxID=2579971 RepID=A0A5B8G5M8_9RHOB|nr:TetR/AcrR family transcriptional regulator [Paroceanicella profunda]QDL94313.1 TetR/AcrR family transcriptional regulator [Paroceanicella profunda]
MTTTRTYNSPLRDEKARATREAILQALYELMNGAEETAEIGMDAIAERAGIRKRTIFRHFSTKEELFAAFWPWLNARIGASVSPRAPRDVIDGPRQAFPLFEAHDAAMRAALHTRTGREMRMGTVEARRLHFANALAPVCASLAPEEARRVTALAHLLYSASAWEVLKDYGGLSGAQAGEAASWALEVILSAVTKGEIRADVASQRKDERDEA